MSGAPEILVVSPAMTAGWRTVEAELAGGLDRLGVRFEVAQAQLGPSRHVRRAWPLVDLVEAAAARRALREGLSAGEPRAIILLTSTATLLAPVARLQRRDIAVAIRLDCPAAVNRPGPANAPQRALERRRLRAARLAIAMGPRSAALLDGLAGEIVSLPTAVEVPAGAGTANSPRVLAYTPDPGKKGLDTICGAWQLLGDRRGEAVLTVAGIEAGPARAFLAARGVAEPEAVEWDGMRPREGYLELLAGAHAYVSASRREDHGIAQLEALAAGIPLATGDATGAYEAWPIAHELAPELAPASAAAAGLADALAAALAMDAERRRGYREQAARLMAPFSRSATDAVLRERVLPALLGY